MFLNFGTSYISPGSFLITLISPTKETHSLKKWKQHTMLFFVIHNSSHPLIVERFGQILYNWFNAKRRIQVRKHYTISINAFDSLNFYREDRANRKVSCDQ